MFDELQDYFDMDMLMYGQELGACGVKVLEMNDYLSEYGGDARPATFDPRPGFVTSDISDGDLHDAEARLLERETKAELARRASEKLLRRPNMQVPAELSDTAKELIEAVSTSGVPAYREEGRKRWKFGFKNVVTLAQKKKGIPVEHDSILLDTTKPGNSTSYRTMTKKEYKEMSWGGRKMKGLFMHEREKLPWAKVNPWMQKKGEEEGEEGGEETKM